MTPDGDNANALLGYMNNSYTDEFALDQRFKPFGLVTGVEGHKGQEPREVEMAPGEVWTQAKYNEMHERYQRQTLEQLRTLSRQDEPSLDRSLQHSPSTGQGRLVRKQRTFFASGQYSRPSTMLRGSIRGTGVGKLPDQPGRPDCPLLLSGSS
jgi:hypothetical protein